MAADKNVCACEKPGCRHQECISFSRDVRTRIALTCFGSFLSLRTCPLIFQVQCVGVLPVSGSAVNFLVFIQSKCLIMKLPSPNYNLKPQY